MVSVYVSTVSLAESGVVGGTLLNKLTSFLSRKLPFENVTKFEKNINETIFKTIQLYLNTTVIDKILLILTNFVSNRK